MCIGMASTFAYANSTLREQVALKVSPAFSLPLFPANIIFHAQKSLCVEPLLQCRAECIYMHTDLSSYSCVSPLMLSQSLSAAFFVAQ